jgi:DNA-binding CsgD family transcriptional regulator
MAGDLQYGRECYERGAWSDAYDAFRRAEQATALADADLERLGLSAYLIGRELDFERCFEQLQRAQTERGERQRAARSAFWLGLTLMFRGEGARSNAWISRGQRLVDGIDCVEQGYLIVPSAERELQGGHAEAAHATAVTAAQVGRRFEDADLIAIAQHVRGRALVEQDQVAAGLALLDETMLPVVAGELSPIVTGLLYCSVIETCRTMYSLARAREWTFAFSRWCDQQSEALAFSGTCLVNRAEILRFHGAWPDALADTFRACECAARANRKPPATALYQRAEVHRLRGEHVEAEDAYRAASELGCDPQPGLALLRLAQGRVDAACATMRRTIQAATTRVQRARLLPSYVEIMLASGEIEDARVACEELRAMSDVLDADGLRAAAARAEGEIALADGRAGVALGPLRRAFELWTELDAPYDAARARVLIALACRALDDDETAALEFAAARSTFARLAARADLVRLEKLEGRADPNARLSPREQQVLRLIAKGRTNKAIAGQLRVSERTIDRHVSNILNKLDVPSRAAATAYAYEHKLI